MTNEQAKKAAATMAATLVREEIDQGWPFYLRVAKRNGWVSKDGVITPDGHKVEFYLTQIRDKMEIDALD